MDGHAGDARVGPHGTRSRKSIGDRVPHRAFGGEIEPHAHRFGFVDDVRRQDFATTPDLSVRKGRAAAASSAWRPGGFVTLEPQWKKSSGDLSWTA
jgi:hypothetical protein